MKQLLIILLLVSAKPFLYSQASLQLVLDSIEANNLRVKSSSIERDAQAVLARTGLNPPDPEVEYGYFPGNKPGIGIKTTFSVAQSFYFPTVYARKKAGSNLLINKSDEVYQFNRREIFTEAASAYIELVYLDKSLKELRQRAGDAELVRKLTEKSLKAGEANQLEMNKALIESLHWKNEMNICIARKAEKEQKLTQLNHGKEFQLDNPEYPVWQMQSVDSLIITAMKHDPVIKVLEYDIDIAVNNVRLQQSLLLPQFTAGYGQETILGDSYRGIQAGVSIPLWQNRNTVKHARLQQQATENGALAYKEQVESDIKAKHRIAEALKTRYNDYSKSILSIRSGELLKKALDAGNISVLEYYRELLPWYEVFDQYLISERDYYLEMVSLMKYSW